MGVAHGATYGPRTATKRNGPLLSNTLWTFTQGIKITDLYGIVRANLQVQSNVTSLAIKCDTLLAVPICAGAELSGLAAGTMLHITDDPTGQLSRKVSGVDATATSPIRPRRAICQVSGIIQVFYSAPSTGIIDWYMLWEPLVPGATVA